MTNNKSLLGSATYFCYLPPVRLLRVESTISRPKFIVPITAEGEFDLAEISTLLKGTLSDRRIGLNLDFCPPLLQASEDIDTVRDFINQAAALNFYNQMVAKQDPRSLDVAFVADNMPQRKRALKYSKFTLPAKHLFAPAKRYYRVTGVECMRLIDLEEHHINEAGLTYAPHNMAKGKLNSRFADSIESIYRDSKYKARANNLVAVLTVQRVPTNEELVNDVFYEMGHIENQPHIGSLIDLTIYNHIHNKTGAETTA